MADTSPLTTEECLVMSVWFHKKGQSGQIFPCILIKQQQLRLIYVNWRKNIPNQFRCKTKQKTTEICRCGSLCPFGGVSSLIAQKIHKEIICRISDPKNLMWQQECATLLHIFPVLVSRHNIMFTDECAVHLSARSQNVYIWDKQNTHFFEVAQHPPHVMMEAEVTNGLIIGPYFFDVPVTGENLSGTFVPLANFSLILQQDGTPTHYTANMCAFLNNQFPL
jgi:hypothetical protein